MTQSSWEGNVLHTGSDTEMIGVDSEHGQFVLSSMGFMMTEHCGDHPYEKQKWA